MVKLVNQTIFASKIKGKNISIFSPNQIIGLFGLSKTTTDKLLHRYTKSGFIIRLKRGLYAFPDALPPDLYIANKLYSPSYISLEFALAYHGVIPEIVYEITSVTTKATRRFEVKTLGKVFSYRKIKKNAYTGYNLQKLQGINFNIADAEKSFVDANYLRLLSKQKPISRFRKEKINQAKAMQYAELFGNQKLISIIKTTLK
ncbi:type IV toxin-antitoxin system AbiEi family antitoxin domain-containing protein [Patescibacteria group bacterium]|nr:type IV toxin-antitoxin system AbiEi family antitoxin domain-containing protein [Patescibacteria group bacterium]MBU4482329.1 type IV toxin-antitoxin system AbiEi family antitoxin domain-containing protein [Patescibacteria group bacterium]